MKAYIASLLLTLHMTSCQQHLNADLGPNENQKDVIIDNIQISEKPSDGSGWKNYCVKVRNLKKDIPCIYPTPRLLLNMITDSF